MNIIDFLAGGTLILLLVGVFAAYAFYSGESGPRKPRFAPSEGREDRWEEPQLLLQELTNPSFRATDDRLFPLHDNRTLQERFFLGKQLDDGLRVPDIVVRIELQFLEDRIFAHQILNRVFQSGDQFHQFRLCGGRFHVKDDFVVHTKLIRDRESIF